MKGVRRTALASRVGLGLCCAGALLVSVDATPGRGDALKGKGYLPGLGDLMNASMQVHHTKLWLAGQSRNWALAAYELKEIKETVEDIQTFAPNWHGLPIGEMVKSLGPGVNELNRVVASKNSTRFSAAFHELTTACNNCHVAAKQPEITIIVPMTIDAAKFSDQDFTAAARLRK